MNKPVSLFLLLILFLGGSCRKFVEDQKQDLLLRAMTDGLWHVETFLEDSVTITDQFTGYDFQFHENGTVTGLKDSLVADGTWIGNIQDYSIISNFPAASDPLKKLNGTWKIRDTGKDFVVAETAGSLGKNILHLRKNP